VTSASDGPIDTATIRRVVAALGDDGAALVAGVIETYLAEAPALLGAMRAAMSRGSTAGLRDGAHSLKSSAAALGATRVSEACARLEIAAEAGDEAAAAELVAQAEAEHEAACAALEETIVALGGGR
jgi:HPt (histidine-containing phosphotransfer) domain-containing protein